MVIPSELRLLYRWIESRGYTAIVRGGLRGFLAPPEAVKNSWSNDRRVGGTWIEFFNPDPRELDSWFGRSDKIVQQRLRLIGRSGGDGSSVGLWIDDDGKTVFVHLGSGSGSTLVCVLAETGEDFVRLLAVGYDEIDEEVLSLEVEDAFRRNRFEVAPNEEYRSWLKNTFHTSIPCRGTEVVRFVSLMDDDASEDRFWQWVRSVGG